MRRSSLLRRRSLNVEPLEARRPLAAYISEIHFDPLFGSTSEDQYIELRNDPNTAFEPGTYLVVVQSSDGVQELGDIRAIFDLSGQAVGDNGMLVLMQADGGYTVDPKARVLRGTNGFVGMPDSIYRGDADSPSIGRGSTSFLLVNSQVAPSLSNDIDGNDDGVPDGAYLGWSIIDSVAVFPWGESVWKQKSYAQITFRERNVGGVMPGTTSVVTDQLAYVARINQSTGYSEEDWVAGNTVEKTNSGVGTWEFQLQHGVFGAPRPYAYGGRFLDHVGSENWVGSISGTTFMDENSDGVQQPGEAGVANATIRVATDIQNTGYDVDRILPNNYPLDTDVSNASPYVTIVSASSDNVPQGFKIRVVQRPFAPAGQHIFSHEGVGFFNENRRMRMDFYAPAKSVSITFIGNDNFTPTYGRLEIFNKAGESMGFLRTRALSADQEQRLSLSSPNDDIAWALAYPEDSYLNSSPFGRLDDLEVHIPQRTAKSDANGHYKVVVPNDQFSVGVKPPATYDQVFPTSPPYYNVNVTKNQQVIDKNFGLLGNRPPRLADTSVNVSELLTPGAVAATLPVSLGYPSQKLKYTIRSGDPAGLFAINASGQLTLTKPGLDFESVSRYTLDIQLEDLANAQLNDTALIDVVVQDGNEPPTVAAQSKTIAEGSPNGTAVVTMTATDPDAGAAGTVFWSLISGNVGDAFAINESTGQITVSDASALDFETRAQYNLVVRATDRGVPPQLAQVTVTVTLSNVNEAPQLPLQSLVVDENSAPATVVGSLTAIDQDQGQTLNWQILGGSGQALFALDPNSGEVTVASQAELDFESQSVYTLQVQVTDSGSPPLSARSTVTIALIDRNDAPEVSDGSFAIDENAVANTVVGNVSGSDQDAAQKISYSLSGADAAAFVIDSASGQIRVAPEGKLDYESQATFILDVTGTDNGETPLSSTAQVTITLRDLNEAPTISTSELSLPENSPAGFVVGKVEGGDPDAGDAIQWSILSQSLNWVEIDSATGELKVKSGAEINFESAPKNLVVVRAEDKTGLSTSATITLSATDRNEPPVAGPSLPAQSAKVGVPFSYTIPADAFTDPDAGDQGNLFVTLASGFPTPGWLSFNAGTRTLSGTPSDNDAGPLQLSVTMIDSAGASASTPLLIEIASATAWHNSAMPMDVSGDQFVTARDALLVINYLNVNGAGPVPGNTPPSSEGFYDTSKDNSVTALDVLLVINQLNQQAGGEGEPVAAVDMVDLDTLFTGDNDRITASRFRFRR